MYLGKYNCLHFSQQHTERNRLTEKPENVSTSPTFLRPFPALANSPYIRAPPGDFRQVKLYVLKAYACSPL